MTDREKYLENLKIVRATMDEAIKQVEMEVEKEREEKRPALALGQVWKSNWENKYYVVIECNIPKLISLSDATFLEEKSGFDELAVDYTYIGMARDCVKVKAEV